MNLLRYVSSIIFVALVSACAIFKPADDNHKREVRESFEKWRQAVINGDVHTAYSLTSRGFLSKITFNYLYEAEQQDREKLLQKLPEQTREKFNQWYSYNLQNPTPRLTLLPDEFFGSEWIAEVYQLSFKKARLKDYLQQLKILNVAVASSEATISVSHPVEKLAYYTMIYEDGMWKVDDFISRAG